ncbi:MAG: exodeoxyribonuclease III [Alphaproteobacteria bacterium]
MTSVSIATFNINSIKARLPNLLAWLDAKPVDILLLQELKCEDAAFPALELEDRGYNLAVYGQKTYNGVAICSKFPLDDVVRGLGGDETDDHARYIEAVASVPGGAIRVASAYVPNGQDPESDKFAYKLRFLDRLRAHWTRQLKYHEAAALGGDFNCAPEPLDVYDPRRSEGAICFNMEERWRLRALMDLGLYDAFRVTQPEKKQFSWWDYRAGAYEHGIGLRIDHILLSAPAVDALQSCEIDEAPRKQERPSDHTPVIATLEI